MPLEPGELIVQGDIEAACVGILRSAPEILALCPSTNISVSMIGYTLGMPWVLVERQGGALKYPYAVDRPRIDFEVHGNLRENAIDLASMVQAVFFRDAVVYSGGVHITNAKVETGIYRKFDKDNEATVYVLSLRFTARPRPA